MSAYSPGSCTRLSRKRLGKRAGVGSPGRVLLLVVGLVMVPLVCGRALAHEERFAFTHSAQSLKQGRVDYEQWVTWKASKDEDSGFDRLDLRHEFEFGLTDSLDLEISVADWRYEDGESVDDNGTEYLGTSVGLLKTFRDPLVEDFGFAVEVEAILGDELAGVEFKLILQKNIGPWVVAYNAAVESEWEGDDHEEDAGEFEQMLGVAYQVSPQWTVGGELVHELEFEDWNDTGDDVVYVGPNTSYRTKSWWVTVTQLFQVTDVGEAVDFQTRLILGLKF